MRGFFSPSSVQLEQANRKHTCPISSLNLRLIRREGICCCCRRSFYCHFHSCNSSENDIICDLWRWRLKLNVYLTCAPSQFLLKITSEKCENILIINEKTSCSSRYFFLLIIMNVKDYCFGKAFFFPNTREKMRGFVNKEQEKPEEWERNHGLKLIRLEWFI